MEWRVEKQLSVVGCQLSAPPKKSEAKTQISYSFYKAPFVVTLSSPAKVIFQGV